MKLWIIWFQYFMTLILPWNTTGYVTDSNVKFNDLTEFNYYLRNIISALFFCCVRFRHLMNRMTVIRRWGGRRRQVFRNIFRPSQIGERKYIVQNAFLISFLSENRTQMQFFFLLDDYFFLSALELRRCKVLFID